MQRFRKGNRKGFTMIELMVVVVIVGVLAAIAIPIYGKYIKNAKLTEATARMGEIITACKSYAVEHADAAGVPQWPTAAGGGIVDLSSSANFSYALSGAGLGGAATGALTVTATGIAGGMQTGPVTVAITVPNINSNGSPPVVTNL